MNTPSFTTETDNLVLFPSSKTFRLEEEKSDPMVDLLTEFSDLSDSDIPSSLDDRFEAQGNLSEEAVEFDSLEAFMNRHEAKSTLTREDLLVESVNKKIEAIAESKSRIKFYLDEIEMFLPKRR